MTDHDCSELDSDSVRSVGETIELWPSHGRSFSNGLTFRELAEIEERAHRSSSKEAETILRLAIALREAMQMEENALALLNLLKHPR